MSSARLLVLTSQAGTQMSTKVRNYCHRIMKLQRLDIKKKRWYPTLTDADVRAELRHLWPGLMRRKTATGSEMSVSFMF